MGQRLSILSMGKRLSSIFSAWQIYGTSFIYYVYLLFLAPGRFYGAAFIYGTPVGMTFIFSVWFHFLVSWYNNFMGQRLFIYLWDTCVYGTPVGVTFIIYFMGHRLSMGHLCLWGACGGEFYRPFLVAERVNFKRPRIRAIPWNFHNFSDIIREVVSDIFLKRG